MNRLAMETFVLPPQVKGPGEATFAGLAWSHIPEPRPPTLRRPVEERRWHDRPM